MHEPPFGVVVDPRDVSSEAEADEVRMEVWTGVAPGHGGTCTTYAIPLERLTDALAWQRSHPELQITLGITTRLNGEVVLLTLVRSPR
jgi:hypothetical protein